jgi:probable F420-dependent oxidoreductase
MAALAGATERIKFGMNAVVVSVRDPLVTAKQCATIDFLSGGRLLPVFGVGRDTAPEFRATGRSPRARGSRSNEALELMRRLWSEESVSFEGEHYRYEDASISPRPVQQPLPLWIGGSSPAAIRRTARLGTGWLGGTESAKRTGEVIAAIRAEAPKAGRTIPDDHYGATIAFRFGSDADPVVEQAASVRRRVTTSDPRDLLAVGDAAAIRTRIGEYVAAGASKFVMIPLARGDDDLLEQSRRLVGEVLPAFEPRAPV